MLIQLLVVLVILGVLLYLLNVLVPMDNRFKTAINVIVGLLLFLYIVDLFTGHHYSGALLR